MPLFCLDVSMQGSDVRLAQMAYKGRAGCCVGKGSEWYHACTDGQYEIKRVCLHAHTLQRTIACVTEHYKHVKKGLKRFLVNK